MTNGFFGDQITLKRRHSAVLELDKNFRNEKPLSDDVDNDSFVRSLSEPSIDAHPEQHQKIAQPTDSKLGSLDALQKPLPPTPTQAAEYANHEDIINLYRTTSATSHSDISIPTPNPDIHADTFNLRRGGSAMSIAMSIKTSPTQDKSPEPTQNPNRSVNADTFSTPTFPKFEFPNPQKLSQSSLFQDPTTPTKFPVDFGFTASSFTLDRPAPLDLTSAASSNSLSKELPPKPRSYDINSMSDGELLGIQKVAKIDLETLLQISVPDEEANVETAHAKGNRFGAFFQKFTQNWKPTKEFTGERVELKPSDSLQVLGQALDGVLLESGIQVGSLKIPKLIYFASQYLLKYAITKEGIFRVSGSSLEINRILREYGQGKYPIGFDSLYVPGSDSISQHEIADIIKQFLKKLPRPIIPESLYPAFRQIWLRHKFNVQQGTQSDGIPDHKTISCLRAAVFRVPKQERQLLQYILGFCSQVAEQKDHNQMSAKNLAIVFAPNFFRFQMVSVEDRINYEWSADIFELMIHASKNKDEEMNLWKVLEDMKARCQNVDISDLFEKMAIVGSATKKGKKGHKNGRRNGASSSPVKKYKKINHQDIKVAEYDTWASICKEKTGVTPVNLEEYQYGDPSHRLKRTRV